MHAETRGFQSVVHYSSKVTLAKLKNNETFVKSYNIVIRCERQRYFARDILHIEGIACKIFF